MAGEAQDKNWPLPKFYFMVGIGDMTNIPFQEVSGLETEEEPISYRDDTRPAFSVINMPGLNKQGSVTMKKGVFPGNDSFWDWYDQIKMNVIARQTVTIKLLDEAGAPTMTWTLNNAWPTKITGTDLKTDGNEVAVESITFAHEGISMANG